MMTDVVVETSPSNTEAAAKIAADAAAAKAAADAAAQEATDKAAADAAAKATADAEAAAAAATPPDTYTWTVPKGGEAFVDDSDLQRLEAMARKAGWSQEDAQAALEEAVALESERSAAALAVLKADKTYGGDKLANTQTLANAVIDRVRPEGHPRRAALVSLLQRGGVFNNVEAMSLLADLGTLMAEDSPAAGGGGGSGDIDAATKLYGKTSPTP